jgi:soluble lytic murein transglycosylase
VYPFLLALSLLFAGDARAQTAEQGHLLARALDAARAGDWDDATALAHQTRNRIASDIVEWVRLRDGAGTWSEYADFLDRNADWPGLAVLRRSAERLMPEDLEPWRVTAFYYRRPPETGTGALRLADAYVARGEPRRAEAEIARAWRELSMSGDEQKLFRAEWSGTIKPHHLARLDNALWQGWTREAEAMLPLVDPDWQALGKARLMTRRDAAGLQAAIQAVPKRLRGDPGLSFERYLYRVEKGRWEEAEEYLLKASTSKSALGRPEMWMERRANLARQALRRGEVRSAYKLAAMSFGETGPDYADAEWLAGFIALTRMDDPERAIGHFRRFQEVVLTPISLGRAGYWLGLAHERAGDPDAAKAAYLEGARHQTSFYGQLAADRSGHGGDGRLAGTGAPDWRKAEFLHWPAVVAARFFDAADDEARVSQFLRHAAERQPAGVRAAMAQMAIDLGRPAIGIRIAKDAAAEGIVLPSQYYPLHPIAKQRWPVPTEFAMAIARQESELDPAAVSAAGARGLMQLMPATAQHMAEVVGTGYDPDKLTKDPKYNARLGTTYLARMLDRYDGSYVLASAAYNAGPGRVDEWIETFGDPRDREVDAVTWIETIPFTETRNYVMRVLEGLHVYRARLRGKAVPVQLAADIDRTG